MFKVAGPPSQWISRHGRPAPCMGDGAPSYTSDHGLVYIMGNLVFILQAGTRVMGFPANYRRVALNSPDGLVNVSPHGGRKWRPIIYEQGIQWTRRGSQEELYWRYAINFAHELDMKRKAFLMLRDIRPDLLPEGFELDESWQPAIAARKAEALLKEHLTPQQRIELAARDCFRVRGAATKNVYEIRLGDGFALVDKVTAEELISYCYHPEEWMPDGDVALTIKFALEDPELEEEYLSRARMYPRKTKQPKTRALRYARDIEKELICVP